MLKWQEMLIQFLRYGDFLLFSHYKVILFGFYEPNKALNDKNVDFEKLKWTFYHSFLDIKDVWMKKMSVSCRLNG